MRWLHACVSCSTVAAFANIALNARGHQNRNGSGAERTLAHGGRQRTYLIHDFGGGGPAPVVIVLHGDAGTAEDVVRMTGSRRPGGTRASDCRLPGWHGGAQRRPAPDVERRSLLCQGNGRQCRRCRVHRRTHRHARHIGSRRRHAGLCDGMSNGGNDVAPTGARALNQDRVVPPAGGPLQLRLMLAGRVTTAAASPEGGPHCHQLDPADQLASTLTAGRTGGPHHTVFALHPHWPMSRAFPPIGFESRSCEPV